jgi:hypothetical protein
MQRDLFILPSDDAGQHRLLYYDELTTPIINPITAGRSSRKLRRPHNRLCHKIMDVIYLRARSNGISNMRRECQMQNKIRGH